MEGIVELLAQWGGIALIAVFALFVLGGLIFGLIRGWKRSLLRFLLILVCIILAAGLAPISYQEALVTDLSSINIGVELPEGNLGEIIEGFVEESMPTLPLEKFEDTLNALLTLASIFINLIIFVTLFVMFRFLSWILFGILKLIFFGKDRKHKKAYKRHLKGEGPAVSPYKKRRMLGGLIGMAQGVAILLVFVVLVTAPLNAFNAFVTAAGGMETLKAKQGEEKNIYDVVDAFNKAYDGSVPDLIYTKTGLDKLIYDNLTTIQIDNKPFTLEDFGTLAGTVVKGISSLTNFPDIADSEAFGNYLDELEDFVTFVFDNVFVKIILKDLGDAIKDGLDLEEILGGLGGDDGSGGGTGNMSFLLVDESGSGETGDDVGSMILPMLLGMINDLASSGNLADALKDTLVDVINVARDLNDDGTIAIIMQLSSGEVTDPKDMFESADDAKNIGKALDKISSLDSLGSLSEFIFTMLSGMIEEPFKQFGIDMDAVELEKVKWESMMATFYEFLQIDDISAIDSQTVVNLITSLEGQWVSTGTTDEEKDPSGIISAFETIFKNLIADMNLGVDSNFLADKKLDLIENKIVIGALLDLMNDKDTFDNLNSNANNLLADKDENLEAINKLSAHVKKMEGATDDFNKILRQVISTMMGGADAGPNPVKTISKSLEAYKLIINMGSMVSATQTIVDDIQNWDQLGDDAKTQLLTDLNITDEETINEIKNLPPEEAQAALTEKLFDEDKAEELIDLVADDGILNMLESQVGDTPIDLGNNKEKVEETLDKLAGELAANSELEQSEIDEKLEQYGKLADLLGLDTSKIPNLPGFGGTGSN